MSARPLEIIIVGGGIGGLTAASALAQRGHDVHVYERAPEIREVGAGVMISPNAMRLLNRLGMGEALRAVSVPLTQAQICEPAGQVLADVSLSDLATRFGAQSSVFHRAALQGVLLSHFVASAGEGRVHLGATYLEHHEEGGRVRVRFDNGREAEGDVLIGADGLNSAVRGAVVGDIPQRFSGQVCWRGIAEGFEHPAMPLGVLRETQGPAARFGACHVDANRVYWFAVLERAEGGPQGLCPPGDLTEALLPVFGQWGGPVPQLLAATPTGKIVCNDLKDLPGLERWHNGRAVLLGDAAHAMTPNLGQGACSAIEDGWVLAHALSQEGGVEAALSAYYAARIERTRFLQTQSWRFGKVGQLSSPLLCWLRGLAVRMTPRSVLERSYQRIYGYEPPGWAEEAAAA